MGIPAPSAPVKALESTPPGRWWPGPWVRWGTRRKMTSTQSLASAMATLMASGAICLSPGAPTRPASPKRRFSVLSTAPGRSGPLPPLDAASPALTGSAPMSLYRVTWPFFTISKPAGFTTVVWCYTRRTAASLQLRITP